MPDDATPDPQIPAIPEVPESFDELSDDALRGLYGELEIARAARLAAEQPTGLTAIRAARDELATLVEAQNRIAADLTERMAVANEMTSGEVVPLPVAEDPPPETPPETPAEGDGEGGEGEETPAETEVPAEAVAVTAAQIAANREPGTPPPGPATPARPRVAMVAAAGTREQGAELDFAALGDMIMRERKGPNAHVELTHVAAFEDTPEIRDTMLGDSPTHVTDRMIRETVEEWRANFDESQAARTASAGERARRAAICDPLDTIREIPNCSTDAEPFSDSLPGRPAGRLGFQFTPSATIATVSAGVDVFDETDQANVVAATVGTWKPCVAVSCPTPSSVRAEAITACFSADNTTDMSNPERIRDIMSKIAAQRARTKEARLLQIYDTTSHHFEAAAPYGALDGLVHIILTTLAQADYTERLDGAPYIFWSPPGLLEALVIDRAHQTAKADFDRGDVIAYVEGECAAAGQNVRVVDLLDVELGGQTPFASLPTVGVAGKAALPNIGGTTRPFKARLGAPESFLYFSTGEINMGIERSPDLNRQNRFQWFAEEYVGLAKHGCHPAFTLHLTICPTGSRAALTTAYACPTTAS